METVQNGHDDCGEYPITREDLETLKLLCQDVLIDREDAKNILPTQSGFFFGSTEYDEDYFDKARYTLKVCEDALLLIDKGANLTYSSSWYYTDCCGVYHSGSFTPTYICYDPNYPTSGVSGSAGSFSAPLFGSKMEEENSDDIKKVEATEATGASSAGQYSGPSFLAKSQSKKDWRGASKPLYKGGKFVKVKKKCLKYPYCNQGDINALKLTELDIFESLLEKLSKEYQIDKNILSKIIKEDILKNSIN